MIESRKEKLLSIWEDLVIYHCRHPGNYLSTRLCLVSDRLLSGIHAIRIKNREIRIKSFSFPDSNFLILISIAWIPAFAGMTTGVDCVRKLAHCVRKEKFLILLLDCHVDLKVSSQ